MYSASEQDWTLFGESSSIQLDLSVQLAAANADDNDEDFNKKEQKGFLKAPANAARPL